MSRSKAIALLGFLIGLTMLLQGLVFAATTSPDAPELAPSWLGSYAITDDTSSPNGAEEPDLAMAVDGSEMTIAYIKSGPTGDDANPYFRSSTSANWDTWTGASPIHHSSPAARSMQLDITYDPSGNTHAVWRDQAALPSLDTQLIYKNGAQWGVNLNHKVITTTNPSWSVTGASTPRIAATSAITLDIVWSQDDQGVFNVFHTRSTDSGTNWSAPSPVANTASTSAVPSIALDQAGTLHVAWEESVFIPFPVNGIRQFVYYSSGTPAGGSTVNWTTPITISKGTTSDKSRYPEIVVDGNSLYVSYSHWLNADHAQEKAHLVQCSQQCAASSANWALTAASSQFVDFNLTPNDSIVTSVAYGNGCAYVHYDGIPSGGMQSNEIIWGLSSCDAAPDPVTATNVQSIIPSTSIYGQWLHLAFEQKGMGNRHIYYNRGKLPYYAYLPAVIKGS